MRVEAASKPAESAARRAERPSEVVGVHTRLIRMALGIEESRAYWEHVDPAVPVANRALLAFEQRWFGSKSLDRVRFLLANFAERYDAFPEALTVLRRWRAMDASTRQLLCHWHLQLSDPFYRSFTGQFLVARRGLRDPKVDRDVVLRWVKNELPGRWAEATSVQVASKLLSATSEAGLISPKRDPRTLLLPKVPDVALAYLLHLLRSLRFAGTLIENPYLASVGLTESFLDQRLRALPGITFHRLGQVTDFEWDAPTLAAWAEATL
jgi:hypothetical protein